MAVRPWNITEEEWSRVQASERIFKKAIKGKKRWDRIRNEELRKSLVEYSIERKVQKTILRWFGCVKRMEVDRFEYLRRWTT